MDDIEEIKQLKARYMRAVDTKDWDLVREVLTDDFFVDSGFHATHGADDVIGYFTTNLADIVTVHHTHLPEIELTSATTAKGIWAFQDLARYADGRWMDGYGHHHETYEKVDGSWKVKSQVMSWVYRDTRGLRPPVAD